MMKVFAAIGATLFKLYEQLQLAGRASSMTEAEIDSSLERIDASYERDAAKVRRIFRGS